MRSGGPRARRRPGRCGSSRDHHLLPQGVHPRHEAVPRPLPLLHVRDHAGAPRARRPGAVPHPRRDPRDRARGRDARLHRGAVHPRRPPRGPLARGPRVARRAGLRLHARLRARDGDPRARGDRPAAAPQPRRHVVGGDEPAQAGLPLDGDDARDDLAPPLRGEGPGALRIPRQGPRRTPAGAGGRRPPLHPVHDRPADRHRREPHRARRVDLRAAPGGPAVRPRAGGHRPELPGQARHRDAPRRRPRAGGVRRRPRRGPGRARPEGAAPGTAEPRRARRVPGPARRRRRRLGRRLPPHPRPREPRAPLALAGAAAPGHRRLRLRPPGATDRAPVVRPGRRAVDRPPRLHPRRRPVGRRRLRARGRPTHRPPLAGARRRLRLRGPGRPPHRGRHRGPHRRPPLRLRRGLRRLGRGGRARRPYGGRGRRRGARPRRGWDWPPRSEERAEGVVGGDGRPGAGSDRPQGGRARPRQPVRRARAHADDRRGRAAGPGLPARRRPPPRDGRRRRHLRGQPEHQLHQRLLRRLPVLRLRPATHGRRRLLPVPGPGGRPRRGGLGPRSHRGLHAGRHRPGARPAPPTSTWLRR